MSASPGALFVDGEVRDREHQKGSRKDVRLQGFDVFVAGFLKALLESSRFGPLYLTQESLALGQRAMPPWLHPHLARLRSIPAHDPSALCELDRLILLSVGPEMIQFAWLRAQLHRRDWPITAILHSLSLAPRIRYFFTNALLPLLTGHDALVCPSQAAKRALERVFLSVPEEIRVARAMPFEVPVIPMGIETEAFRSVDRHAARLTLGLAPEFPVLLYFGRLAADKCDLLPLLLAFSQLSKESGATLVIAGDDTQFRMAPALLAAAHDLACADRVRVLADVSRQSKLELFAAANIFVSPTENTQESFGLTIGEAMASGLPVVTSDWAAHRELVEHGATGFLVSTYLPPISAPLPTLSLYSGIADENRLAMSTAVSVEELRHYLQLLCDRSDLRDAMGQEARRRAVATLDWRRVVVLYDELWSELLDRAKANGVQGGPFACSSFQEVFADYPTRRLDGSTRIELASQGGALDRMRGALGPGLYFQENLFARLLALFDSEGPAPVSALVSSLTAGRAADATDVERHIGRLIKYGLLRVAAAPERGAAPGGNALPEGS